MRAQLPKKDYPTPELASEQVVVNWLTAVAALQRNYTEIRSYIDRNQLNHTKLVRPVSQCSADELLVLLSRMEDELANLLHDMEQSAQPKQQSLRSNYEKLIAHTVMLEKLNQQAACILFLTLLPAS